MARTAWHRSPHRRQGAAAILAMMFLVIFGSLAAAMAIVAQGNLSSANNHRKINRSLAAAETGMRFIIYRLNLVTQKIETRDGEINSENATVLWNQTRAALMALLEGEPHNLMEPYECVWPNIDQPVAGSESLHLGPIQVGPGAPQFITILSPHPLPGEDYDADYYQRAPYNEMDPPVSNENPLDATFIRVRTVASDGPANGQISRAIQMDFRVDKKIRFAILSKSRVMLGRNVMIEGPIGSKFIETQLANGHPIQMESDFLGLSSELDAQITALHNTLIDSDQDGDNRINLNHSAEVGDLVNSEQFDTNQDGYIDDYDFFLDNYDANNDGNITALELDTDSNINATQLLELIDTFGDSTRPGYGDGMINQNDRYAKIRGQVLLKADLQGWLDGAAGGAYQDFFQGPIHPDHNKAPLTFQASEPAVHDFEPSDFDVSSFRNMANGDLIAQAAAEATQHNPDDPNSPQPLGNIVNEHVPFGAAHPYDFYNRPVFENMTFSNVLIPQGSNALFKNCKFIGVTFVETTTNNNDPNYNFAGMTDADGSLKHPDRTVTINGNQVADTKTISNNVRFDNCTFEGAIVSDAPSAFTHVRNKLAFTGKTKFAIDASTNLNQDEKDLFKRSTILTPHYSVEMGTFVGANDRNETVELSGTIVAGLIDIRGHVKVNGTILTTFEPQSDTGPVLGPTSPQFNTTLGYFSSQAGDLEAELPESGIGVIQIRYDPTLALPDGILGPIEVRRLVSTYFETR